MNKRNKMWHKLCRFANLEDGTQLVELAIVLPIIVVLFAVTAEFGRFFYTYTTLAKATRAGARYLATKSADGEADQGAKKLVVCGDPAVALCDSSKSIVNGLDPELHVQIMRVDTEAVTIQIEGFTYQPLFDLGKLTGIKGLSLSIEVSPSTTMKYLLT